MKPLSKLEFSRLMKSSGPYPLRPFIAVAASGGRDSLALALLMKDWVFAKKGRLIVLTVDHGLRKESAAEAKTFQRRMKKIGIDCEILSWRGKKPKTGIQEAARDKRYELLLARCKKLGATYLALGHQEEDQAETFLIRLMAGSGIDGLCGMRAKSKRSDIVIIRPLLTVPRARLAATCKKYKMEWLDDPSNQNADYKRVRLRHWLEEEAGGSGRIALVAGKLSRVREFLESETQKALELAVADENTLDLSIWRKLSPEIRQRVIASLIRAVSGQVYPPRQEKLDGLMTALQCSDFKGRTLGGCVFGREKRNKIFITQEK